MSDVEDRFWSNVDRTGDCWIWIGSRLPSGYGRIGGRGYAHRVSWALANGPIPAGMCILHRCDNPPCVNPSHLWIGTVADNMHDRDRKGRHRYGPNRPSLIGSRS